jgi:hypothetical protein
VNVKNGFAVVVMLALAFAAGRVSIAQTPALPDAIKADSKSYSVEFENDIVRLLRVKVQPGVSIPRHSHVAYCAIETSDSSLKEPTGPVSNSKTGQVFCGDATAHAPTNVGKGVAESIVVEFKGRQKAK